MIVKANNKFNVAMFSTDKELDTMEFHLMSETLSSINFEDKLTDGQYEAIMYFAKLYNVTPIEVVGDEGKNCVEYYLKRKWEGIMSDAEQMREDIIDGMNITRKEMGLDNISEIWMGKPMTNELDGKEVPVNKFNPIDLDE